MLQRCVKSAKKCLLFFFEYIVLQLHAIMCLHLRDSPDGQAADNEPLSRADKARGVSCKVQSSEYTPLYNRGGVKVKRGQSAYFIGGMIRDKRNT